MSPNDTAITYRKKEFGNVKVQNDGRITADAATGLSSTTEPVCAVSALPGFDPLRERVRVILDCEWGDLQHALDMVIDAKPTFDRHPNRPGWGWHWSRHGMPAMFVRRTKQGFSATANRPKDTP